MTSQNNLSELLSKLLTLNKNSVESFSKVNEAVTSDSETVTINIENPDGSTDTFTIPSFGYLKNSIERLNNNLNAVANINGGGSTVRLSDGTYRKVLTSKLPSEAPTITRMNSVNTFKVKSNWFFENMMNPLLCVTVDLTGQIPQSTENVVVRRYILDTDTDQKETLFQSQFAQKPDIDYNTFLQTIVDNGIGYVLDEETVALPPRSKRYDGKFSVIKITNDTVTELVNGASITRTRKLVKLNTLSYSDTLSGYPNTMQLAVGDSLEVNSNPVDTRYIIKQIDTSTNTVVLELVEGYRSVRMGSDFFKISSQKTETINLDVTVGFNEHCVVFVKPVDSESNIMATEWSPGTGFITNNLTFTSQDGKIMTLQQYYQKSVVDFGAFLLSYANDWYPSSSEGVTPDAPTLSPTNFKVVQINKQVTESDDINKIKQLNAEKANLSDQISAKGMAINDLKTKINTTNYVSPTMRTADISELQNKIKDYESTVSTYSSKVSAISALSESSSVASVSPKFRVRGFWEMPQEKSTPATGAQAIIKFKIRYRYLNPDGAANAVEQIGDTASGTFSNYNVIESVLRERVKDANGVFYWKPIDMTDSDEININQLDIPITKGEKVEIQVKSVSEAGFPSNPLESEWSEPMVVEFPEEFSTDSPVDSILKSNSADESQRIVDNTLNSRGVTSHVSDSFNANGASFLHTAMSIASGFVTDEQTPISLYQKLADMQQTINQLVEIIGNSTGVMSMTLSDENGNVFDVKPDTVTKIYAGAYITESSKLTVKKGAIITKNYSINIHNTAQTGLRLIASIAGSRSAMVKESNLYQNNAVTVREGYPNIGTYDAQDNTYNTFYRYDLVPVNLYAAESSETDGIVVSMNGYQSAQCRNQFINMRFKDISGDISLYRKTEPSELTARSNDFYIGDTEPITEDSFFGNEFIMTTNTNEYITESFIWNPELGFGTDDEPVAASTSVPYHGNPSFMVHIDHPCIASADTWYDKIKEMFSLGEQDSGNDYYANANASDAYAEYMNRFIFRLAKNFPYTITNNRKNDVTMKKQRTVTSKNTINIQTPYEYLSEEIPLTENGIESTIIPSDQNVTTIPIGITHKLGYEPNDQYLLGKDTCTSYLFLNPQNHAAIQVDGDSRTSSKVVGGGAMVSIPITFQYRMTDYWGSGESGNGRILGDSSVSTQNKTNINNICMSNRVGIDVWNSKDGVVSFDLEIYATYGDTTTNISPDTLVKYNASTMKNAVNGSKNTDKTVAKTTDIIDITPVTLKKK